MTSFEEAIVHSAMLQAEALFAIAIGSPDKEAKIAQAIDFNPYSYLLGSPPVSNPAIE